MKHKKEIKEEQTLRYMARFKVIAACPLGVGSGQQGILSDRLIARDAVGLPYIPGASLAGIIRHELEDHTEHGFVAQVKQLFGYQEDPPEKESNEPAEGQGSRIHFGSALLIDHEFNQVHEGLALPDYKQDYYSILQSNRLAERDHVRITHQGVAAERAKYEEELVPKGTAFCFQIELLGTAADREVWMHILHLLHQPTFRVGAGTRKGFGQLEIQSCQTATYDLNNTDQLLAYLQLSHSYNTKLDQYWQPFTTTDMDGRWIKYLLSITPKDFFHFGAGIGDEEVNHAPKTEHIIDWEQGRAVLKKDQYLIPATSLKGAIAHRVAYHYNNQVVKANEKRITIEAVAQRALADVHQHIEQQAQHSAAQVDFGVQAAQIHWASDDPRWEQLITDLERTHCESSAEWLALHTALEQRVTEALQTPALQYVGEQNTAVQMLFGYAKDSEKEKGARGKVQFSDAYLTHNEVTEKIFNHVKIDRFTGGGIDGALFIEKVLHTTETIPFKIYVEAEALENNAIKAAFEQALLDITTGHLPLGGSTAKGHGMFTGTIKPQING